MLKIYALCFSICMLKMAKMRMVMIVDITVR